MSEKQHDELISTYIPAKEILSNAYQFEMSQGTVP
jgi:hypothetical protein